MSEPIREGKFVKGGRNTKPTTPRPPAPKAQIPSPMEVNKMTEIILSDKEQELYYYIGTKEDNVTVKLIETELGKEYVGALGKLLHLGLIKSEKRNLEVKTGKDLNPYGYKWVKCYFVEKEK